MRDNPINGFLLFMTGRSGDEINAAAFRWPAMTLWWLLLIAGAAIAIYNWRRDPEQRSAHHLFVYFMRVIGAAFWFAGSLWKLPLPVSEGFKSWMDMSVQYSSFQWHADFMNVFVGYITIVGPLVYLLELSFCISLMLGLLVRVSNTVSALFILNLLIGLYNDPTEWMWTYVGLIMAFAMFATSRAGRSLGVDNLIAKRLLPIGNQDLPAIRVLRAVA
jgi:uncharacterized membrane protein YphA (DoxX/SURF4 family)